MLIVTLALLVVLCQSFRNQGPGYTELRTHLGSQRICVNPSEIKDLVTLTMIVAVSMMTCVCQSFRNQGPGYTDRYGREGGTHPCVNPSEIKDLVTPSQYGRRDKTFLCQSFRNQGPGYTLPSTVPHHRVLHVSILQKSRTWLHSSW